MNKKSPRQKLLSALDHEAAGNIPCSFMMYKGLHLESTDYIDFLKKQLALGLEPYAMIPPRQPVVVNDTYNLHGMDVRFDPAVRVEEWIEDRADERFPVMVKEYLTPAGTLRAEVRQTEDWRWGNHIPLFDDYISPRAVKYIVEGPDDLPALQYLLAKPTSEEIEKVRAESAQVIAFAREHDLLLAGGWGVGADMLGWIYGFEQMVYASMDAPGFLHEILDMIAEWNRARMQVLLDIGIDLYIKRTWYETCNFWSPKTFQKFVLPILAQDAEIAHASGARFGCYATDKAMPLLKYYPESGMDVLIGVDPHTFDLVKTKEILKNKVCLWGGVNGHLTVELGSEADTRKEVRDAIQLLGDGGGFILSPVDNVREYTAQSNQNVAAIIDEWGKSGSSL